MSVVTSYKFVKSVPVLKNAITTVFMLCGVLMCFIIYQNEGVAVLRMRLVDWQSNDSTSAVLSVWRPSDDLSTMIKENHAYRLYHVTTSGLRFREIQLNSVKQTRWDEIKDSSNSRNRPQMASVPKNGWKCKVRLVKHNMPLELSHEG